MRALEAVPGRGWLYEVMSGPRRGQLVLSARQLGEVATLPGAPPYTPPPQRYVDQSPEDQAESHAKADQLLRSLLDHPQLEDYRRTGCFWVDLADGGRIRLGRLYRILHRPAGGDVVEQELCVVPQGHDIGLTPEPDIWTNLLLTLSVQPDEFFRVANLVSSKPRAVERRDEAPGAAPLPLRREEVVDVIRDALRYHRWHEAAMAEHVLARRLARAGRRRVALTCAIPAAVTAVGGPGVPEALRRRIVGTAAGLAPVATGTPSLVDDLVDVAWRRLLPGLSDDHRGEAEAAARQLTTHLRQAIVSAAEPSLEA